MSHAVDLHTVVTLAQRSKLAFWFLCQVIVLDFQSLAEFFFLLLEFIPMLSLHSVYQTYLSETNAFLSLFILCSAILPILSTFSVLGIQSDAFHLLSLFLSIDL